MTAAIVRPGAERSMLAFVNAAIDELQLAGPLRLRVLL